MDIMGTEQRDVFLCHASEDKLEVVRPFVQALSDAGISYWYAEAEIKWGDSITQKVNEGLKISRYVVVILSEAFLSKNWPQREFNSALNVEASSGDIRVLPLLVGTNTVKKRIFEKYPIINDKLYLEWGKNVGKVIEALKARLSIRTLSIDNESTAVKEKSFDIPLPKIKKKFTQRDKDLFLKRSFEVIKSYFQKGLANLEAHYPEVETNFTEVHRFKFISTIYIRGEVSSKCKIWVGGPLRCDSIVYSASNIDIDSDNSFNDLITVSDDGLKLGFNVSGMWFGSSSPEKDQLLTAEEAAEYFWRRFTDNLNQE